MDDLSYDAFLSYSHEDEAGAKELVEKMQVCGLRVFFAPISLNPSDSWIRKLEEALRTSQHFVLYWSPNALNRPWVTKEAETFLANYHMPDREHRRMFVLLNGVGPDTLPPFLSTMQCSSTADQLVAGVLRVALAGLAKVREDLAQERKKVEAAQHYYGRNRFWDPFTRDAGVHIYTCARDDPHNREAMRGEGGRTNIDMWDYRAVLDIVHYFALHHPNTRITIEDPIVKLHDKDFDNAGALSHHMRVMCDRLRDQDCIIIGSPDVSDLAELVLSEIHHMNPYDRNRAKKKGFVIVKKRKSAPSSCYWEAREGESEGVAEIREEDKYTIFSHVVATPGGDAGTMHGILVVANNPFCSRPRQARGRWQAQEQPRGNVAILSGFSGIATSAIAKLLTDDTFMSQFYEFDRAYEDTSQDVEALIQVKYSAESGFLDRDTRRLAGTDAITFEKLVVI